MTIRIEVVGNLSSLNESFFGETTPVHKFEFEDIKTGIIATNNGFPRKGAFDYSQIGLLAIDLAISTSTGVAAAWIYEKLVDAKAKELSVENKKVEITLNQIEARLKDLADLLPAKSAASPPLENEADTKTTPNEKNEPDERPQR